MRSIRAKRVFFVRFFLKTTLCSFSCDMLRTSIVRKEYPFRAFFFCKEKLRVKGYFLSCEGSIPSSCVFLKEKAGKGILPYRAKQVSVRFFFARKRYVSLSCEGSIPCAKRIPYSLCVFFKRKKESRAKHLVVLKD